MPWVTDDSPPSNGAPPPSMPGQGMGTPMPSPSLGPSPAPQRQPVTPGAPPPSQASTPGVPTVGTLQGGYKFKGGDPGSEGSWEAVHGDDFLQTLPPQQQALVKGIVRGDIANPSGFAMAKPYWQQAIAQAQQYDPTFSQTLWPVRASMRQDVAKGKFGQNLNALNTAIQHTGLLANDIPGVWGEQIPLIGKAVNYVGNTAEDLGGDPRITQYRNIVNALSHELRRTYAQTGAGSQADLDSFEKGMSENLSTPQKQAALKQQMQLLSGKANAIYEQYNQAMGPNAPPLKVLAPQSVAALKNMGMNPTDLGFHPSSWVDEKAIATLKANPKSAPFFDKHFGAGAAEQILGE
jgi:hypothetical protein